MIVFPSALKKLNVLGMNARNIDYISRYNDRRLYPLVDDKLQTKKLIEKHGLKAPELFGFIEFQAQVKKIKEIIPEGAGFVIKPAQGSGGKGILVILKQEDGYFIKQNGDKINEHNLRRHISNILSGLYSLSGKDDVALVEKLIEFDDAFEGFSFEGVPDIRVIVYRGYPVMAMMRLSTSASDGKANLHQGAVGVGLNISNGKALSAVQFDAPITHHPDTGKELLELEISQWDKVLRLASGSFDMTDLGYLGADIVLDKQNGPMLLELNARPGLAIQIANKTGLEARLRLVDAIAGQHKNIDERLEFSYLNFGATDA